ncbi:hypothetical protein AKJ16_DCAP01216 [Drosera capensis]
MDSESDGAFDHPPVTTPAPPVVPETGDREHFPRGKPQELNVFEGEIKPTPKEAEVVTITAADEINKLQGYQDDEEVEPPAGLAYVKAPSSIGLVEKPVDVDASIEATLETTSLDAPPAEYATEEIEEKLTKQNLIEETGEIADQDATPGLVDSVLEEAKGNVEGQLDNNLIEKHFIIEPEGFTERLNAPEFSSGATEKLEELLEPASAKELGPDPEKAIEAFEQSPADEIKPEEQPEALKTKAELELAEELLEPASAKELGPDPEKAIVAFEQSPADEIKPEEQPEALKTKAELELAETSTVEEPELVVKGTEVPSVEAAIEEEKPIKQPKANDEGFAAESVAEAVADREGGLDVMPAESIVEKVEEEAEAKETVAVAKSPSEAAVEQLEELEANLKVQEGEVGEEKESSVAEATEVEKVDVPAPGEEELGGELETKETADVIESSIRDASEAIPVNDEEELVQERAVSLVGFKVEEEPEVKETVVIAESSSEAAVEQLDDLETNPKIEEGGAREEKETLVAEATQNEKLDVPAPAEEEIGAELKTKAKADGIEPSIEEISEAIPVKGEEEVVQERDISLADFSEEKTPESSPAKEEFKGEIEATEAIEVAESSPEPTEKVVETLEASGELEEVSEKAEERPEPPQVEKILEEPAESGEASEAADASVETTENIEEETEAIHDVEEVKLKDILGAESSFEEKVKAPQADEEVELTKASDVADSSLEAAAEAEAVWEEAQEQELVKDEENVAAESREVKAEVVPVGIKEVEESQPVETTEPAEQSPEAIEKTAKLAETAEEQETVKEVENLPLGSTIHAAKVEHVEPSLEETEIITRNVDVLETGEVAEKIEETSEANKPIEEQKVEEDKVETSVQSAGESNAEYDATTIKIPNSAGSSAVTTDSNVETDAMPAIDVAESTETNEKGIPEELEEPVPQTQGNEEQEVKRWETADGFQAEEQFGETQGSDEVISSETKLEEVTEVKKEEPSVEVEEKSKAEERQVLESGEDTENTAETLAVNEDQEKLDEIETSELESNQLAKEEAKVEDKAPETKTSSNNQKVEEVVEVEKEEKLESSTQAVDEEKAETGDTQAEEHFKGKEESEDVISAETLPREPMEGVKEEKKAETSIEAEEKLKEEETQADSETTTNATEEALEVSQKKEKLEESETQLLKSNKLVEGEPKVIEEVPESNNEVELAETTETVKVSEENQEADEVKEAIEEDKLETLAEADVGTDATTSNVPESAESDKKAEEIVETIEVKVPETLIETSNEVVEEQAVEPSSELKADLKADATIAIDVSDSTETKERKISEENADLVPQTHGDEEKEVKRQEAVRESQAEEQFGEIQGSEEVASAETTLAESNAEEQQVDAETTAEVGVLDSGEVTENTEGTLEMNKKQETSEEIEIPQLESNKLAEEVPKVEDKAPETTEIVELAESTEAAKTSGSNQEAEEAIVAEKEEKLESSAQAVEEAIVETGATATDVHESSESTKKVEDILEEAEVKEEETLENETATEVLQEAAPEPLSHVVPESRKEADATTESAEQISETLEKTREITEQAEELVPHTQANEEPEFEVPEATEETPAEEPLEEHEAEEVKDTETSSVEFTEGVKVEEKLKPSVAVVEEPRKVGVITIDASEAAAEETAQVKETFEATTAGELEQEVVKEREFSQIPAEEELQEQIPHDKKTLKDQYEATEVIEADSKEATTVDATELTEATTIDAPESTEASEKVKEISEETEVLTHDTQADELSKVPEATEKTLIEELPEEKTEAEGVKSIESLSAELTEGVTEERKIEQSVIAEEEPKEVDVNTIVAVTEASDKTIDQVKETIDATNIDEREQEVVKDRDFSPASAEDDKQEQAQQGETLLDKSEGTEVIEAENAENKESTTIDVAESVQATENPKDISEVTEELVPHTQEKTEADGVESTEIMAAELTEEVTEEGKIEQSVIAEEPKEVDVNTIVAVTEESDATTYQVKETIDATNIEETEKEVVKHRDFSLTSAEDDQQEQAPQQGKALLDQSEATEVIEAENKESTTIDVAESVQATEKPKDISEVTEELVTHTQAAEKLNDKILETAEAAEVEEPLEEIEGSKEVTSAETLAPEPMEGVSEVENLEGSEQVQEEPKDFDVITTASTEASAEATDQVKEVIKETSNDEELEQEERKEVDVITATSSIEALVQETNQVNEVTEASNDEKLEQEAVKDRDFSQISEEVDLQERTHQQGEAAKDQSIAVEDLEADSKETATVDTVESTEATEKTKEILGGAEEVIPRTQVGEKPNVEIQEATEETKAEEFWEGIEESGEAKGTDTLPKEQTDQVVLEENLERASEVQEQSKEAGITTIAATPAAAEETELEIETTDTVIVEEKGQEFGKEREFSLTSAEEEQQELAGEVQEKSKGVDITTIAAPETAADDTELVNETTDAAIVGGVKRELVEEREFSKTSAEEEKQELASEAQDKSKEVDITTIAATAVADETELVKGTAEAAILGESEEKLVKEREFPEGSSGVEQQEQAPHQGEALLDQSEAPKVIDAESKELIDGVTKETGIFPQDAEKAGEIAEQAGYSVKKETQENQETAEKTGLEESSKELIEGERAKEFVKEAVVEEGKPLLEAKNDKAEEEKLEDSDPTNELVQQATEQVENKITTFPTMEVPKSITDAVIVSRDVQFIPETKQENILKEPQSEHKDSEAHDESPDEDHEEPHSKHKHSHNIFSKVKQSFVKAKKSIIGKHPKPASSETKENQS